MTHPTLPAPRLTLKASSFTRATPKDSGVFDWSQWALGKIHPGVCAEAGKYKALNTSSSHAPWQHARSRHLSRLRRSASLAHMLCPKEAGPAEPPALRMIVSLPAARLGGRLCSWDQEPVVSLARRSAHRPRHAEMSRGIKLIRQHAGPVGERFRRVRGGEQHIVAARRAVVAAEG